MIFSLLREAKDSFKPHLHLSDKKEKIQEDKKKEKKKEPIIIQPPTTKQTSEEKKSNSNLRLPFPMDDSDDDGR